MSVLEIWKEKDGTFNGVDGRKFNEGTIYKLVEGFKGKAGREGGKKPRSALAGNHYYLYT